MPRDRGSELNEAHNQGQTDASKGENNPPGCAFDDIIHGEMWEDREAYRDGQEAHKESSGEEGGGGCFLTTACVEHAGLSDDCHELTVLRSFRDSYVAGMNNGAALLAEYYEVAPAVVRRIEESPDREAILSGIFATVTRAVKLIENGNFAEAFTCYETMFAALKERYYPAK